MGTELIQLGPRATPLPRSALVWCPVSVKDLGLTPQWEVRDRWAHIIPEPWTAGQSSVLLWGERGWTLMVLGALMLSKLIDNMSLMLDIISAQRSVCHAAVYICADALLLFFKCTAGIHFCYSFLFCLDNCNPVGQNDNKGSLKPEEPRLTGEWRYSNVAGRWAMRCFQKY